MPDLAELNLKVSTRGVRRALTDLDRLGVITSRAEKAILGLVGAISGAMLKAIAEFARFEQVEVTIQSLIGNVEEAGDAIDALRRKASESPFGLTLLANQIQTMKALGTETKALIPDLETMLDTMSAIGGPLAQENLRRFAFQVGEIRGQGKLDAEDLRRLADIKIPAVPILLEALQRALPTATSGDLRRLIREGRIASEDAIDALFEGLRERYTGAVRVLTDTVKGQFDVLKNNIQLVLIDVGDALSDAFDLKNLLAAVSRFLQGFGRDMAGAIRLIARIGTEADRANARAQDLVFTFRVLTSVMVGITTIGIVSLLKGVALAIKSITVALATNPFILLATAAGVAAGWITYNWKEMVRFGDKTLEVGDIVVGTWDAIWKRIEIVGKMAIYIWNTVVFPKLIELWNLFLDKVGDVMVALVGGADGGANGVLDSFKSMANTLIGLFKGVASEWDAVLERMKVAAQLMGDDMKEMLTFKMFAGTEVFLAGQPMTPEAREGVLLRQKQLNEEIGKALSSALGKDYVGDAITDVKTQIEVLAKVDPEFANLLEEWKSAFSEGVLPSQSEIAALAAARAAARAQEREGDVPPSMGGPKSRFVLRPRTPDLEPILREIRQEREALGLTDAGRKNFERQLEGRRKIMGDFADSQAEIVQAMTRAQQALVGLKGLDAGVLAEQGIDLSDPDRASKIAEAEANLTEELARLKAAGDAIPAEMQNALARLNDEIEALASAEKLFSILDPFERGVRDAFVDGITAALYDEDWQEVLRRALMDISKEALGQGLNLGIDALLGTNEQGNQQSLAGLLASVLAPAVGGAAGAGTGGAGAAAAAPVGKAASVDVTVFNVPDESTADTMMRKASSRGAAAVVARGSGNPGITAGSARPGRRK